LVSQLSMRDQHINYSHAIENHTNHVPYSSWPTHRHPNMGHYGFN
jgi:hypothetical protein